MNIKEIVENNYDAIKEKAKELYMDVLEHNCSNQYKLHVWSDGKFEVLESVSGSNTWLATDHDASRRLYYLITIKSDMGWEDLYCYGEPVPDTHTMEYRNLMLEAIEYLGEQYDPMEEIMDNIERNYIRFEG